MFCLLFIYYYYFNKRYYISVNYESENQGNIVPLSTDAETSNDEGANKQRARRNSRRFFQSNKTQEPHGNAQGAQGPQNNAHGTQGAHGKSQPKLPDDSEGLVGVEQEPQAGPSEANVCLFHFIYYCFIDLFYKIFFILFYILLPG